MSKQRILITGASGFVGYNACEYFLKKKWEVFGLAPEGKIPKGAKLISADLLNVKQLTIAVAKAQPTVVLHLGAYVVLDRSYDVAKRCVDVNIHGTLNLLEAVKNISLRRFIFFSTEEVYGQNALPYKETQVTHPPSAYSISKVAGESLCLLYKELYKVPIVIFRMATVFGAHQPTTRFIPGLIMKALKNEDLPLNSGKNKRDYLFVDELIAATEKAISAEKVVGQILNIGGTAPLSGKELAQKIVKLTHSTSKILLGIYPDRVGEAKKWKMSNTKAQKILGWKPGTSIDNDLKKTINFYHKYFL